LFVKQTLTGNANTQKSFIERYVENPFMYNSAKANETISREFRVFIEVMISVKRAI